MRKPNQYLKFFHDWQRHPEGKQREAALYFSTVAATVDEFVPDNQKADLCIMNLLKAKDSALDAIRLDELQRLKEKF